MKTKTKLTVAIASVLSVVALAGTGYAGWVISQNAEDKANGNVLVYKVKNNAVDMTNPVFVDGKSSIIWGKDSSAELTATSWFSWTNDGETNTRQEQFFTPKVKFEVSNKDTTDFKQPIVEATLTVTDVKNKYETCRTAQLINGPKAGVAQKFDAQSSDTGLKTTITQKANEKNKFDVILAVGSNVFGWGSHFAVGGVNKNPAYFYNAEGITADKAIDSSLAYDGATTYFDDANKAMSAIYGLDGITFEINITISHAK